MPHRSLASGLRSDLFPVAFENAPIGMAITDADGRILRANGAFCALVGYTEDELVGMTWKEFTHPDDLDRNLELYRQAVEHLVDYQIEKRYVRKDGTVVWAQVRASSVRGDDGALRYQIGQVIDVTERRRAEEAREELIKRKDDFIARLAHELRTPLTAVQGLTEELAARWESFDSDTVRELLSLVVDQSRELSFIVDDLLVEARTEVGELTVVPERVDVGALVAEVARRLGVEVTVEGEAVAQADPLRLRQVLRNLLTNAKVYGGDRREVQVTVDGDRVRIDVRDDGPGLAPADREHVFEPYYRAHRRDGYPGSLGLGLSVARSLARMMGGDIEYRREGLWSVFGLTLPNADGSDGSYSG